MSARADSEPKPCHILVAEDDPNDVLLLKRVFVKAGFTGSLHFVATGSEVIDYLVGEPPFNNREQHPFPHLLLMDVRMPGPGGLDVLEWIQKQPHLSGVRIIVFSSCFAPDDLTRAARFSAVSCITKPLNASDLAPILRQLWGGERPGSVLLH